MVITTIVLSVIFLMLFAMYTKVFFYQRTIRKVHMRTGIDQKSLDVMYPPQYITMHTVSLLRWIVIGGLFYFNWIVAVVCLVLNFLLPAILPEQDDYANIKKARKVLFKRMLNTGEDIKFLAEIDSVLKTILDEIDNKNSKPQMSDWPHLYDTGYYFSLHMKNGDECIGKIISLDYEKRLYEVEFDTAVSLMPAKEPEGGWKDNAFPRKVLMLNQQQINDIRNRFIEGTTRHYHF